MTRLGRPHLAIVTLVLVVGLMALTAPSEALICPHYFCRTNSECASQCPSASSSACIDNVCEYTYPGDPGGGFLCPHFFCTSDQTCQQGCPQAPVAQCIDNVCQYSS